MAATTANSSNLFAQVSNRLGLLTTQAGGLNEITKVTTEESTQAFAGSPLDMVRRDAEFMAQDIVHSFTDKNLRKPPNRYCKTLRRTVKELCDRHDLVFKGMVNRLKPNEQNAFGTFVIVADEIFVDGQINWGRIVAVYAFAARLAQYSQNNESSPPSSSSPKPTSLSEKIALFVGKYVANKLGQWILDHGGWDALVEYFPDHGEIEDKIWKGVLFTAFGLGALALVASR